MIRREIHVPIYWLIVGLAVMVVSPILAVVASVKIAERNAVQLAEQYRLSTCNEYGRLLDIYKETPPATETGRNVRELYVVEYRRRGCLPARTE